MGILELPVNPGALVWTGWADHPAQAVLVATWRCPPPPAAFLPVGAGREGAGAGGFHPCPEVSADSASLSLPGEPICCRELRKSILELQEGFLGVLATAGLWEAGGQALGAST